MLAKAGKPKTNTTKVVATAKPTAVNTAFSKGAADEQAAAEAQASADRREALKKKTADMLELKKKRMQEQAQINATVSELNQTALVKFASFIGNSDALL